jgi:peptidoglycan/LPS O-acetylase OafA/YrhL
VTATRTSTREFLRLTSSTGPGLPHFPALDGLRGLAVAGVVLYHCGFAVMVGGFLGVSTFFTLSGFLITGLLLRESQTTGGASLGRFWGRRFRRLLPASLATLALVVTLFSWFVATAGQRATLRGDTLAALLDVANWRFVAQGTDYGALFAAPSPVLHFWSLAIEEQLYVLLPLALVLIWRATGGNVRRVGATFLALAALSTALPWLFTMSDDRVYFGTDTRAAELLLGAVLAAVFTHAPTRRRLALDPRVRTVLLAAGGVCLSVQLWWWWTLEQSSSWLYRGGLTLYAAMTCVVIAAATLPSGPLRVAFGGRVIRWLGARSYGIYLAHWPLLLAARKLWPDGSNLLRSAGAIAATLAVAELSFRLLEQPVRTGRWPGPRRAPLVAVAATTAVAVLAFVSVRPGAEAIDFAAARDQFDTRTAAAPPPTTTPVTAADGTPVPPTAPGVLTFGDSTALLLAIGMTDWAEQSGELTNLGSDTEFGCAIPRVAESRFDVDIEPTDSCTDWEQTWPRAVEVFQPQIAQVVTGTWEVADIRLPGASEFSALGDPEVDRFVSDELTVAADTLSARGALVLFVLWPPIGQWSLPGKESAYRRQADPARMARLHEIQRSVAAARPESVRVLDLAGWLGARVDDEVLRPDGTHIAEEDMAELYREGLGAETVRIYREWWQATQG